MYEISGVEELVVEGVPFRQVTLTGDMSQCEYHQLVMTHDRLVRNGSGDVVIDVSKASVTTAVGMILLSLVKHLAVLGSTLHVIGDTAEPSLGRLLSSSEIRLHRSSQTLAAA